MTHGSLFAGIGGFDLGFERAGIKTVWQVEIDPFCRRVLAKHFPEAERFEDVRTVTGLPRVDIISGGFPCQDISLAGKLAGIDGERSGLWRDMWRVICDVRPRFVVVENVSALLYGGIERVLGDLAAGGFAAEWDCIPASAFGAPHRRDRIWIVAYPEIAEVRSRSGEVQAGADQDEAERSRNVCADVSNAVSLRGQKWLAGSEQGTEGDAGKPIDDSHARTRQENIRALEWWATEPNVGRVAHGIPARVDRLKGLGNAIVPQIAEWIGRRIIEAELSQGPQ